MDPTGKQPAEDPSSAAGLDWRSTLPPSARSLNRALLVHAFYCTYVDSNATMAQTTALLVEMSIHKIATDKDDYLRRVSEHIQLIPRTPQISQAQRDRNLPDSSSEKAFVDNLFKGRTGPLQDLHRRHVEITFCCFSLERMFAVKMDLEKNAQLKQHLSLRQNVLYFALNTFKSVARRKLTDALDDLQNELRMRAKSGQMINSLEEWYAAKIEGHLHNFFYATTYKLDELTRDKLQQYMQWLFNNNHGRFSSFFKDAQEHYQANIPRDLLVELLDTTSNLQQQPLPGHLSEDNTILPQQLPQQQQPLAGFPSDGNPIISPQPQLQQQQSVAQVDLTSQMEQMNELLAECSQKMLNDDNNAYTESLFDESINEFYQNFMQALEQPPLEVEQQPLSGNLPDGNAIPPPERQPE